MNLKKGVEYIEGLLKIKTKDNRIVPFILNRPQKRLYDMIKGQCERKEPIRILILKARQMGFSTLTEALLFHRTATKENVNSMIIAHKEEATSNLFNMTKLYYEELPEPVKPMKRQSNSKELIFENPAKDWKTKGLGPGLRSRIKCATAGGRGVGRSDTLTNIHASEYAFWEGDKKATLNGLLQAVPPLPDTMVIIESTANGYNEFKDLWDMAVQGESDFIPLFFPWYEMKEYRIRYSGFTLTQEEKKLAKRFGLDKDQIAWRRWCIKNNCGGDATVFQQEYPATPEEAFLSTGNCVFDKEKILARLGQVRSGPKPERGEFTYEYDGMHITDILWKKDTAGKIAIYERPKPKWPYVLGGDTAGEGSDYFTAHVLDNVTGKQVAVLRQKTDEDIFARQVFCLGEYYNHALIGLESNFSTYPVKELERLGYLHQFVRQREDDFTHSIKQSFGFRTDSLTRPVILGELIAIVRDYTQLLQDELTLVEMLSFIRNKSGRPEAERGQHDDLVMGLAIAYYIRCQQTVETGGMAQAKAVWRQDQWEDYQRATPEQQKRMLDKWGLPKL